MKKIWICLFAVIIGLLAVACGYSGTQTNVETQADEAVEIVVFAAASMTETLTEIAELYKEVHPNVTLTFNFDSSGTLKTQIEEGAVCDLFISAGQKQMDQLDIKEDTRMNILENKVVLAVPEDNPKTIETFEAMVEGLKDGSILLAMGNSDVPVGQYTQKIFDYYKLDENKLADQGVITYGSNAKEVTTQVQTGVVDCGIIYGTDAYSAGLNIVAYASDQMCGQVIYPAAVMNTSEVAEDALDFLDYLTTDEAMTVFERVGFTSVE